MRRRPPLVPRRPRRRFVSASLRRHPMLYWLAVALLATVTVHGLASAFSRADHERRRWGETRSVFVARRNLDVGETIDGAAFDVASWPVALVPDGALDAHDAGAIVGRTVVAPIEPGEAILAARLAPGDLQGLSALVPIGWRAVAIPAGPAVLALGVGDHVDLVAATASDEPPFVLSADALVVAVAEQSVTVAVPAGDAPRVAFAAAVGGVVPVLRPG